MRAVLSMLSNTKGGLMSIRRQLHGMPGTLDVLTREYAGSLPS